MDRVSESLLTEYSGDRGISHLPPKYKPARFHILLALRLLANPEPLPRFMNSRDVEDYCKPIQAALWDSNKCDDLIVRAAWAVNKAVKGKFNRDTIRTEPTTKNVIAL